MSFGSGCFLSAAYSCAWRGLENSIDSAPTLACVERRQDRLQRDVVDVRAFPVAVADVQPHAVARNALDALVDRGDMQLAALRRTPRPTDRGYIMVRSIARSGASICRISPALWIAWYSLLHLARDRVEIGVVAVVVRVQHRGRDDAGRGRGHERLGERALRRRSRLKRAISSLIGLMSRYLISACASGAFCCLGRVREAAHQICSISSGNLLELACRAGASTRRRSPTCAAARRSGSRRAAARRHCRCRCRPRSASPRHGAPPCPSRPPSAPGRSLRPPPARISRSDSFSLRGRLPTWVVRMRSRLQDHGRSPGTSVPAASHGHAVPQARLPNRRGLAHRRAGVDASNQNCIIVHVRGMARMGFVRR